MSPEPSRTHAPGAGLHARLYALSVLRTLAFYGTATALCTLFPLLACAGIAFFFLKFYRPQIAFFLRHPRRALFGSVPELEGYSFEVLRPGDFGRRRGIS